MPGQPNTPAARAAGSGGGARAYLNKPADWYKGDEAKRIAEVVMGNQAALGGWPKNVDTTKPLNKSPDQIEGTFDNNATFDELRLLAKIHTATGDAKYLPAIEKGIDLVLKSQYPTGGWPQSYPPDHSYHRYITFNDGSMARLLFFVAGNAQGRRLFVPYRRPKAEIADCVRQRHRLHPQMPDRGRRQTDRLVCPARRKRLPPA